MHDPAHVARPVAAQDVGALGVRAVAQQPLEGVHGLEQAPLLALAELGQHPADLGARGLIERREGRAAALRQPQMVLAAVGLRAASAGSGRVRRSARRIRLR